MNALLLYAFAALVFDTLGETPGLERAIGSIALGWLVLAVAPTWLAVAVALHRWQRQGRPDLLERAARWDALLWLGPLLAIALIPGTPLHEFLFAPLDDHTDPRKEIPWARSSFS